jgi:uncharacterized protein
MSTEPLPTTLDVRKAAMRGLEVSGVLRPQDLPRFRPLLASDEGSISVEMRFSRNEDDRYLAQVVIDAEIAVICQRCLEAMSEHVVSDNKLAVVWTDEEAAHLPRYLDPLIATEPTSNLWDVAEDELMLAMRPFSYHDPDDCKMKIAAFSDPNPSQEAVEDKPNPFDVLGQLKPGSKF